MQLCLEVIILLYLIEGGIVVYCCVEVVSTSSDLQKKIGKFNVAIGRRLQVLLQSLSEECL